MPKLTIKFEQFKKRACNSMYSNQRKTMYLFVSLG